MINKVIHSLKDYLELLESTTHIGDSTVLFRGQSDDKALLPSICRDQPSFDSTKTESKMLEDFKRRVALKISINFNDDWDWLVYAQHYGMHTRLLDWSSNPLTAIWFACSSSHKISNDSYVYVLNGNEDLSLNRAKEKSPFEQSKTKILRPALNNERIIAQAGWFTAHKYSKSSGKFVDLGSNPDIKDDIFKITIPAEIKLDLLKLISILGVNHQTLFPDVTGVSKLLNWSYLKKL